MLVDVDVLDVVVVDAEVVEVLMLVEVVVEVDVVEFDAGEEYTTGTEFESVSHVVSGMGLGV